MKTLKTINGESINTLRQLEKAVKYTNNITCEHSVLLNGEQVLVYKHWSNPGNFILTKGNEIVAEIQRSGEYFPYIENGQRMMDRHGLYEINDVNIVVVEK